MFVYLDYAELFSLELGLGLHGFDPGLPLCRQLFLHSPVSRLRRKDGCTHDTGHETHSGTTMRGSKRMRTDAPSLTHYYPRRILGKSKIRILIQSVEMAI